MRVLDLFSGIGGFSLGLERCGFQTVAFCEVDQFCQEILSEHWPGIPVHKNIKELDGKAYNGKVELVCGGFPCQPHSVAGRRRGEKDERNLWPEMLRIIGHVRPNWVIAENVPGIRTTMADQVIEDLEKENYSVWPLVVGADDVGAPHRRKRVFFIARLDNAASARRKADGVAGIDQSRSALLRGRPPGMANANGGDLWNESGRRCGKDGENTSFSRDSGEGLADANSRGCRGKRGGRVFDKKRETHRDHPYGCHSWPEKPGGDQSELEPPRVQTISEMGREFDGLPERLVNRIRRERLKALGNSVVPQVIEAIGRSILNTERDHP